MYKRNINFDQKVHKISIKALDLEKLPKPPKNTNFKQNAFLNMTKSTSNIIDIIPSSIDKQMKKTYMVKPMTSRGRNDNSIKLNDIPKTFINATPMQKIKQLSRNKNLNDLFTQSIYQSYYKNNTHSSAKCLTFNANLYQNKTSISNQINSINQLNILNKASSNKPTSRNLSNSNILVNNSTYTVKIKHKENISSTANSMMNRFLKSTFNNSNYASHDRPNGIKNYDTKNILINGYKSNSNGKNFRGNFNNYNSSTFKKFGLNNKKKKFLSKMEGQTMNENIKKILNLKFFKNYKVLKIFVLWRDYNCENSKDYKYLHLRDFLDKKIINFYYKNKIIRKYNQIKKEAKTWKKMIIPQNNFEVNETNKGSILISLGEYANNTIQSIFFNSKIKNCNHYILYSVSIYIFELMLNQLYSILSRIKYIFKFYYDEEKRAIIKKPSATEIKDHLVNLNKIIEKPNIINKTFQDFIINLSKHITNINLNKIQTKPIVSQYLDLYKGVPNVNFSEIKVNYKFGNIYNDFSSLKIKDTNYFINEIKIALKESQNNLFKYYYVEDFDDDDNFFILLYKIQPIKSNLLNIEEKIQRLKIDNKVIDILAQLDIELKELKASLSIILNVIENKYNVNLVNGKEEDIKIIVPYLIFNLIKNNIIYNNLFDRISLLENNKN